MSLAPTVAVRSSVFDPAKTAQSVLCLEVGRDRFRFLVQDSRKQGCYLEDYPFSSLLTDRPLTEMLPDVFRHHPVLSAGPWQQIRVSVNSPSFTLIPKPLYRKEYAGSYLSLMRGNTLPAHEFAQTYSHESEGFLSVFNLAHPLADYFSEVYPLQPLTFVHQTSALIQATANLSRHALNAQSLYLYFEDEFVTIICREAEQLRYCNRFGYKTTQDLAYYVLYVLSELNLSVEDTAVLLFGEITPFADAYTELSRFLPNLTFGHAPNGLTLTDEFDDLPDHRYLSLYGLVLLND
ncbi:DUF3822 family protein [Spirosoma montaniterrae]|uniref:DUF3822 domain-containing protein n=1 Tax=Spirosoma montaniterrae TaxID=1178516 RepID=A0A1P9WVF1_9BACT|nr:DUF3822 family protein [Spirosoma montaniterrae]AQG79367.1 hypothetical protein AWR27_08565 [Spirosoma montaniterrae]